MWWKSGTVFFFFFYIPIGSHWRIQQALSYKIASCEEIIGDGEVEREGRCSQESDKATDLIISPSVMFTVGLLLVIMFTTKYTKSIIQKQTIVLCVAIKKTMTRVHIQSNTTIRPCSDRVSLDFAFNKAGTGTTGGLQQNNTVSCVKTSWIWFSLFCNTTSSSKTLR